MALQKIQNLIFSIIYLPRRIYTYLDRNVWKGFILIKIGRPFVGGKSLDKHINLFYKKILIATIAFSALAFISGVTLVIYGIDKANSNSSSTYATLKDPVNAASFLIIIFLIAGVIAGFFGTFIFTKFLTAVGGTKYSILAEEILPEPTTSSSSTSTKSVKTSPKPSTDKTVKPTPQAYTTAPTQNMTAKERAEARRKAREELKKAAK